MPATFLGHRRLIRVSGKECADFLQGLITADAEDLAPGFARPAALLTPQGKILFDFLFWRDGDGFVIDIDTGSSEAFIKRLMLYRLRAAVDIALLPDEGITVFWDEGEMDGAIEDGRFKVAGVRVLRKPGRHGEGPESAYRALRIAHGIAMSGFDFALQDAFPHDVLMDLNEGVAFRKGCFVGQEVVSRMKHRGTARRRTVIVSASAPLPPGGTEITANGKPIGTLGTVIGAQALAIVRIDRAGEAIAAGTLILAGDVPVSLTLPAWSGLTFPDGATDAGA
ncbi:folate-binding protein YgfZ [Rhizobiaceae bacterium BDR2-2]|uniref:Folate-binding protein YgfZ n=1 Tax=Ectorhizobium quercum TaxID=2965071 RepID=A0AAE3N2N1_9HYPH|nr:folate-binding protein YgfZ [Ectorhizobium quercum]MCX8999071.1 folate-binding protein YgfZ [Ectorhizobium quercum]